MKIEYIRLNCGSYIIRFDDPEPDLLAQIRSVYPSSEMVEASKMELKDSDPT